MAVAPRPCGVVLIVDDDPGVRALVADALARAGFATLEAASGERALELIYEREPAAIVLDVRLPGISGYEVCRGLREAGSNVPVLFLSGERTEAYDRVAGLLLGGDDYLVKPFAPDELVARLRTVLRRATAPVRERLSRLTRREFEVLRLLADGRTQKEIADDLVIAPKTVGTHIEHILEKLDVRSRAQAVALAYREQLVQVEGF